MANESGDVFWKRGGEAEQGWLEPRVVNFGEHFDIILYGFLAKKKKKKKSRTFDTYCGRVQPLP